MVARDAQPLRAQLQEVPQRRRDRAPSGLCYTNSIVMDSSLQASLQGAPGYCLMPLLVPPGGSQLVAQELACLTAACHVSWTIE